MQQTWEERIAKARNHTLLAAITSLYTALDDSPKIRLVLNERYKRIFRNFAYHFNFVCINQYMKTLETLRTHFYEHCRLELASRASKNGEHNV